MAMDEGERDGRLTIKGRVMALDLGEKRIGVAVSDPTRTIAKAYGMIPRKSRREDFEHLGRIAAEQAITLLVVGLPVPFSGVEGPMAAWVRDYTADLAQHLGLPAEFWDESLTSVQAEESLRARGKRGKKIKQRVDEVAAAFILQSYLDAHGQG